MLLRERWRRRARPAADDPAVVLLSEGPDDSAWFEHRMLAEEMGVPLVAHHRPAGRRRRCTWSRDGGRRRGRRALPAHRRGGAAALAGRRRASARPAAPRRRARRPVALANAPGNGVGDDKALYAFVPRLIEYYLGEKPLLADVPTYLCGMPEQRAEVLGRLDELVLKPVDGYGGDGVLIGPRAEPRSSTRSAGSPRGPAPLDRPGDRSRCPPTRSSTARRWRRATSTCGPSSSPATTPRWRRRRSPGSRRPAAWSSTPRAAAARRTPGCSAEPRPSGHA